MWSDGCAIFECYVKHDAYFCGLCGEFPCLWLVQKIGEWSPEGVENLKKLAVLYREQQGGM
jgi:hypothetical protein